MKEIKQIIPNKIPFKCPVCNGFGTLKHGTLECHGCSGKGWVIVDNTERKRNEKQYLD